MSTALPTALPTAREAGRVSLRPLDSLSGIVLDVPDVLYDATLWRRWLFQLLGRLGVSLGYAEFDRAWSAQLADVHRGRREYGEALQSFLLELGLSWAQVDEIEAASGIQRRELELNVRPLAGTMRVVDALAERGLRLAAWADTPQPAARLAERLGRLFPHACFTAVLTSFDLDATQPAAECYRAALAAIDVPADEGLYVGHDGAHLAGAAAFGLRTVAIDAAGKAQADHTLPQFEDLLELLGRWSPSRHPSEAPDARRPRQPLSTRRRHPMIAPNRRHPVEQPSSARLAAARQSVAAVLFRQPAVRSTAPRVPRLAAVVFLVWLVAVAASYFLAGSWWSMRRP